MYSESAQRATSSSRLSSPTDTERQRRLRQCAADLPFGIYSEQHGWGIILKPLKRRGRWASEPDFYFVQFETGVEVRMHDGEEGHNGFFSWAQINEDIRDHEEMRTVCYGRIRAYPFYGHVWRMWH